MELKNKKVLFIGPAFYDYHISIQKELENFGAKVDFFEERPNSLIYRIYKKISPLLKVSIEKKYLKNILSSVKKDEYEYFFLIRGEIISENFLKELKKLLPNAKFIMYQWDSVVNNNYLSKISYFDKILTFDMIDAKKYQLEYLPLFYTKEYENLVHNENKKIDIVFVGYFHSDRLDIVKKMIDYCAKNNLIFYYHIYVKTLVLLKYILKGKIKLKDLKYITTKSVPKRELLKLYSNTKAVLDIESTTQNGLTMRTMEVLGSGLKLITTNKNIKNEEFYNKENIYYADRSNIYIRHSFFLNKTQDLVNIYTVKYWLSKVLL